MRLEEAARLWREDAAAGATLCPPLPAGTHACPGQGPSILIPFWPPLSGPGSPALPATVLGLWAYVFDQSLLSRNPLSWLGKTEHVKRGLNSPPNTTEMK